MRYKILDIRCGAASRGLKKLVGLLQQFDKLEFAEGIAGPE